MFHFVFNVGMLCPLKTTPSSQIPTFPSSPFHLVVPKNELEKAEKDNRFPPDFSLVLQFEELDVSEERQLMPSPQDIESFTSLWQRRASALDPKFSLPGFCLLLSSSFVFSLLSFDIERRTERRKVEEGLLVGGAVCFFNNHAGKVNMARDMGDPTIGRFAMKGGWLTKRGHKVKNWKRRWFSLRGNSVHYYKNPRV